jgi:biopolymer transport protein ExbB
MQFNLAHFWTQTDTIGMLVALFLLILSVSCWSIILLKSLHFFRWSRQQKAAEYDIWQHPDQQKLASNSAYRIANAGHLSTVHDLPQLTKKTDQWADVLRQRLLSAMSKETAQSEAGLSWLASISSTAPFIGLFGTVWGIYHALSAIAVTGQATMDKIAGPVGEALIMTAFGLVVAIPAALGYNALLRVQRKFTSTLADLSDELYIYYTTGIKPISFVAPPAREGLKLVKAAG